jgi:signal transduction histidine kinase
MTNAKRILTAPFTRRTWAELGYWLASIPLSVASILFALPTLANGPLWAVSTPGVRKLAAGTRVLARRLGEDVPAPAPLAPAPWVKVKTPDAARLAGLARAHGARRVSEYPGGRLSIIGLSPSRIGELAASEHVVVYGLWSSDKLNWYSGALRDRYGWQARGYIAVKLMLATAALTIVGLCWVGGLFYLTFPAWQALGAWWWPGQHIEHAAAAFALVPLGAALLLAAPWLTHAVTEADRSLIRALLRPNTLAERVRTLEQSRAYAVDDSAARLRRIERDLHDGTQAQLVALSMKLGLAKEKLQEASDLERVVQLVDDAHRGAVEAIAELRTLARGIHPPVLDNGLPDALGTLATRGAVPVELIVDIPERPSAAIETIAYFSAAELLANVARHSGARHATLEAVHVPGLLRIRVTDDGRGGASPVPGGGLSGLAERVRTVDGHLDIDSAPGGPTTVTVELPSHT